MIYLKQLKLIKFNNNQIRKNLFNNKIFYKSHKNNYFLIHNSFKIIDFNCNTYKILKIINFNKVDFQFNLIIIHILHQNIQQIFNHNRIMNKSK